MALFIFSCHKNKCIPYLFFDIFEEKRQGDVTDLEEIKTLVIIQYRIYLLFKKPNKLHQLLVRQFLFDYYIRFHPFRLVNFKEVIMQIFNENTNWKERP